MGEGKRREMHHRSANTQSSDEVVSTCGCVDYIVAKPPSNFVSYLLFVAFISLTCSKSGGELFICHRFFIPHINQHRKLIVIQMHDI